MKRCVPHTETAGLRTPGTYALLFRARSALIRVGALGEVALSPGWVVYVGSAFGSGGLAGRLRHHLRPIVRPRWHLDYLRPALALHGAWMGTGPRETEHQWAEVFAGLPFATLPWQRFGASDCRCVSHLFHWQRALSKRGVVEQLCEHSGAAGVCFLPISRLRSQLES